jgi:DNA adenine methylase
MSLKTFVRWSGNKSKHLRHIIPYVPNDYNTYIEPFIGSGALFLKLEPEKWIINDINKDIINVWKAIRDDPEYIISEFKKFGKKFKPMSKEKKLEYCRKITENIDNMPYDIDRAVTYMLMKYSVYMGNIFIDNKFYFRGLDMHIYIQNKYFFLTQKIYDNILNVSDFLNETNGKIYNMDYKRVLNKAKKNDFVFLDPPYVEEHNYQFNYNKDEKLDSNFLKELLSEVKKLDKKGVMWMMTQADTKEVKNIFKNYNIKKFPVYRALNKSYSNELLIMNY